MERGSLNFFIFQEMDLDESERSVDLESLKVEVQQLQKDKVAMDAKMRQLE